MTNGITQESQIFAPRFAWLTDRLLRDVVEILRREVRRIGDRSVVTNDQLSRYTNEEGAATNRSKGMKGDSMLRIVAQSTPAKNGCCLISSAEFLPNLVSCPTIILRRNLLAGYSTVHDTTRLTF